MTQYNVSFAGAGRVAGALCRAMHSSGIAIRQIVSETPARGRALAAKYNASWSSNLLFHDPVDVIIVAVPDHRLREVLNEIKCPRNALVAHTAGSYGLDVFPERTERKGVFYPLQTFSEKRRINFKGLPFFIEAPYKEQSDMLAALAGTLGAKVFLADADHRKMLHLAAVFACNFLNHMLTAGSEISERGGFSFDLLHPLIKETISKALKNGPEASQTGPAVRNDRNTIAKHLDLLSFSPDLQKVYQEVTRSIIEHYKNNQEWQTSKRKYQK
jgi:predicted short-subunit dehydrogenase-like oxidoreductase (DUF2520 family)